MKNRGQTTVLFSLMISVLLIFTLTALEVGRIYCGKIKIRAVIHSAQSGIMADYNRELFERYHLLFMDPTYGSGSMAIMEEKFQDYVDTSLNGQESEGFESRLYDFSVDEIAVIDKKTIVDDHMKLLKKQILEYEKEEGVIRKVVDLEKKFVDSSKEIGEAGEKTERNATPIPENTNGTSGGGTADSSDSSSESAGNDEGQQADDPRDVLKKQLKLGLLALVLPAGTEVSREKHDFSKSVSSNYRDSISVERDNSFSDVSKLVGVLDESSKENTKASLGVTDKLMFCSYVLDHFSYQGKAGEGKMKCETEYILKGKDNDYDNLESVISNIIWMRMPVNYVCLLSDAARQSETLTLATAICTATGTMPMVEVVKYLLLGCWAYGESIYEVKQLMNGNKLPYMKTPAMWNTDLKTLSKTGEADKLDYGLDYEDFLCVFLAMKESKDMTYARMLDVIELNLHEDYENLSVVNLCGQVDIQGKVSFEPLLIDRGDNEVYEYSFDEIIEY